MAKIEEDDGGGLGPVATNTVGGIAGSGDSRLPTDQREPGVNKKKKLRSIVMASPLKRRVI